MIKALLGLNLTVLTFAISYAALQDDARPEAGLYTAAQSQRGNVIYAKRCAACHGQDLAGGDPIPALASPDFLAKYSGRSLSVLFDRIGNTMPADAPGSLTPAETVEIVAFILKANQYPAGATCLPSDAPALEKLVLPKISAH